MFSHLDREWPWHVSGVWNVFNLTYFVNVFIYLWWSGSGTCSTWHILSTCLYTCGDRGLERVQPDIFCQRIYILVVRGVWNGLNLIYATYVFITGLYGFKHMFVQTFCYCFLKTTKTICTDILNQMCYKTLYCNSSTQYHYYHSNLCKTT